MREYFCGWYFKCQSDKHTVAVIPAVHKSKERKSCSIQLITDEGAWNVEFPYDRFHQQKGKFRIQIGDNHFSRNGIQLSLNTKNCSATGAVRYLPLMECRHSVFSMRHTVTGAFHINGIEYSFRKGIGYTEGDRGYSFPKEYAWTQCSFEDGSIMLSVADIPFGAFHFTGVIGIIQRQGKEHRLATYLGAKVVKMENGEIIVRQNHTVLSAKLIEKHAHPLFAPVSGTMSRVIRESAFCRVSYHLEENGRTLFSFETTNASFEYEYPR